ncbi:MAG TPA: hypothetical protein VGN90_17240 [Pyrinomonadaceae bacterium]|nr:hypothetical protein [Pyrinomonadaceae bacterium]
MSRANDIVAQIFLVVFFIIMAGIPLGILVLSIMNFVRAATRRGTIVLQALAAIAVWTILTYVLVMILIVVIFSLPYPLSRADELKSTAYFIVGCLGYSAVGAALIYWTKRQAALSVAVQPKQRGSTNTEPGAVANGSGGPKLV